MAGFSPNDNLSYNDLLYGTMLSSGGEAATSLAILLADSQEEFIDLMNSKKENLHMLNSNFTNPTGLHSKDQYSTTEDMIKLLDYALDNQIFKDIYTTKNYTVSNLDNFILNSTLFSQTDTDLILGGTTGYTKDAGHCLSSYTNISGNEYILVTMKADSSNPKHNIAIDDHIKIYKLINEKR